MRSIETMIIVALTLAGCESDPAHVVKKNGGKEPVLCLLKDAKSDMYFCRDGDKRLWVCTSTKTITCVAVDRVRTTLDGALPEKPSP